MSPRAHDYLSPNNTEFELSSSLVLVWRRRIQWRPYRDKSRPADQVAMVIIASLIEYDCTRRVLHVEMCTNHALVDGQEQASCLHVANDLGILHKNAPQSQLVEL